MRRSLSQRLKRLEARFVPAVKPRTFTLRFVNSQGAVVQTLFLGSGQQVWDPPRDVASNPEPAGKDAFGKT
jgi:hypothetical protein